jgi:LysR family transcriptional regulator, hydrogen peroxide-inducible genes activator
MEMAQVRYFLALCEERNFTRAARCCGVAQPSLTKAIKTLETELGGPLFQRRPDGTVLTELGAKVEPFFAAIWRCVEEIKRMPRSIPEFGRSMTKRSRSSSGFHRVKRPPILSHLDGEFSPTRTK